MTDEITPEPRIFLVIEDREFDAIRALARHRLQDERVAALDEVAAKAILIEESTAVESEPRVPPIPVLVIPPG